MELHERMARLEGIVARWGIRVARLEKAGNAPALCQACARLPRCPDAHDVLYCTRWVEGVPEEEHKALLAAIEDSGRKDAIIHGLDERIANQARVIGEKDERIRELEATIQRLQGELDEQTAARRQQAQTIAELMGEKNPAPEPERTCANCYKLGRFCTRGGAADVDTCDGWVPAFPQKPAGQPEQPADGEKANEKPSGPTAPRRGPRGRFVAGDAETRRIVGADYQAGTTMSSEEIVRGGGDNA